MLNTSALMKQIINPSALPLIKLKPIKLKTLKNFQPKLALEYIHPNRNDKDIDRNKADQHKEYFNEIILIFL